MNDNNVSMITIGFLNYTNSTNQSIEEQPKVRDDKLPLFVLMPMMLAVFVAAIIFEKEIVQKGRCKLNRALPAEQIDYENDEESKSAYRP